MIEQDKVRFKKLDLYDKIRDELIAQQDARANRENVARLAETARADRETAARIVETARADRETAARIVETARVDRETVANIMSNALFDGTYFSSIEDVWKLKR